MNETNVVAKAVIFSKDMGNGDTNFVTILCTVPKNEFKWGKLEPRRNPCNGPEGTEMCVKSIYLDRSIWTGRFHNTLTNYEKHLAANGYKFLKVMPEAKNLNIPMALAITRCYISGYTHAK